jgi:hypothetical protein
MPTERMTATSHRKSTDQFGLMVLQYAFCHLSPTLPLAVMVVYLSFKLSLTWQLAFFLHVFLRWLCVVCSILPSTLILAFADSIPDGVIVIFHWHNPSLRTVALWMSLPVTEMSSRNIFWGVKAVGALGWQPYHIHVPTVLKSGTLILLEPSGPVQACNEIILPFLLIAVCRYLVVPFFPLRSLYPLIFR